MTKKDKLEWVCEKLDYLMNSLQKNKKTVEEICKICPRKVMCFCCKFYWIKNFIDSAIKMTRSTCIVLCPEKKIDELYVSGDKWMTI